MAQISLNLKNIHVADVHFAIEYLISGLSGVLCTVHRGVGVPQKIFGLTVDIAGNNYPDARRGKYLVIVNPKRFRDLCLQPLGDAGDLVDVAASVKKDRELIASKPRNDISWPDTSL